MVKEAQGFLVRPAFAAAFVVSSFAHAEKPSSEIRDFKNGVQQIFEKHCYECHGREKTKGKVDLTKYATWADLEENPELIEEMIEVLDKNEMPPEEELQPTQNQRDRLILDLKKAFANFTKHDQPLVPMRLRRMNRFEYGNVVRDLFDLESWVYSINDRIIRDHSNYFRPESGEMPKVVRVGNRIMGLQQLLENRLLLVFPVSA